MPQRENEDGTITYYAEGFEPDAKEGQMTVSKESKTVDAPAAPQVDSALAPEVK